MPVVRDRGSILSPSKSFFFFFSPNLCNKPSGQHLQVLKKTLQLQQSLLPMKLHVRFPQTKGFCYASLSSMKIPEKKASRCYSGRWTSRKKAKTLWLLALEQPRSSVEKKIQFSLIGPLMSLAYSC